MTSVFVFGSNSLGIHGAGAARYAWRHHGAIRGQGEGLQGNSYAIPTKATPKRSLALAEIYPHVQIFIQFAQNNPQLSFEVTAIGTGFAGHTIAEMAPMFRAVPDNVHLPPEFVRWLAAQHS